MYQYTTFVPLASSKGYYANPRDCRKHLLKVVEKTNLYRASKDENRLSRQEIEDGQRLLKIDETTNPRVMELLGPSKDITFENLERKYIPEYKRIEKLSTSLE